jgi:putative ABC transport system permease protein
MTGIIASVVEAFGELRVNKGRIMLSLIGVAFSVFALTAVLGAGGLLNSALQQSIERTAGRPTVVSVVSLGGGEDVTAAERDAVVLEELDRLGIDQRTRRAFLPVRVQTGQGVQEVTVNGVDPAYGDIYRLRPDTGRWLADSDSRRLAPALVVNAPMYDLLGRPALGTEPVSLLGAPGSDGSTESALVIGVLPPDPTLDFAPTAYASLDSITELPGMAGSVDASTEYLAWVPPERADPVIDRLQRTLADTEVGAFDAFQASFSTEDLGFGAVRNGILAVAGVVLLLGAMGLVNISLVTVRYRVREIGIRRSYGATGGRIFFGVLMESVVATAVAGAVGVTGAVALVKAPFVEQYFRTLGLVDLPPFPVSAVLAGLLAAIAVGVLAGALPAAIATRIKVIDAIRS